jgi:hypothetical protein
MGRKSYVVRYKQFSLRESRYLGSCVEVGDDNSHNIINGIFSDATEMAYYVGDPDDDDYGQSEKLTEEEFFGSNGVGKVDSTILDGDVGFFHIPRLDIYYIYNYGTGIHHFYGKK